jgi:hypothetical protein
MTYTIGIYLQKAPNRIRVKHQLTNRLVENIDKKCKKLNIKFHNF